MNPIGPAGPIAPAGPEAPLKEAEMDGLLHVNAVSGATMPVRDGENEQIAPGTGAVLPFEYRYSWALGVTVVPISVMADLVVIVPVMEVSVRAEGRTYIIPPLGARIGEIEDCASKRTRDWGRHKAR
ncbi:MAG: hypothetical protein ACJ74Y_15805 [Bryobacteraceae bacterium]